MNSYPMFVLFLMLAGVEFDGGILWLNEKRASLEHAALDFGFAILGELFLLLGCLLGSGISRWGWLLQT